MDEKFSEFAEGKLESLVVGVSDGYPTFLIVIRADIDREQARRIRWSNGHVDLPRNELCGDALLRQCLGNAVPKTFREHNTPAAPWCFARLQSNEAGNLAEHGEAHMSANWHHGEDFLDMPNSLLDDADHFLPEELHLFTAHPERLNIDHERLWRFSEVLLEIARIEEGVSIPFTITSLVGIVVHGGECSIFPFPQEGVGGVWTYPMESHRNCRSFVIGVFLSRHKACWRICCKPFLMS